MSFSNKVSSNGYPKLKDTFPEAIHKRYHDVEFEIHFEQTNQKTAPGPQTIKSTGTMYLTNYSLILISKKTEKKEPFEFNIKSYKVY